MRTFQFKLVLTALAITAFFSSCNSLKSMKTKANTISYEAKPSPLEVRGDSIDVMVTGKIPAKYFDKKTSISLNPSIVYNGTAVKLKPAFIKGELVVDVKGATISKVTGGTFTYSDRVAYNDKMADATLVFDLVATKGTKSLAFTAVEIAKGTLTTAYSVNATDVAILAADNFQKVVPVELKGQILFNIDEAAIAAKQQKSNDIKAFEKFVKSGNQLTGISISSYASPDGELRRNDQLSINRTDATYSFLLSWLKKKGVKQVNDSSFYKRSATAEDWDGLKQAAASSDLADRDQIINILSNIADPIERENAIKKLKSYQKMANKLLPTLRRSEITLMANAKVKTDAEITAEAAKDTPMLTAAEILYAATLTADEATNKITYDAYESTKFSIYNKAKVAFPYDWRAQNNMAYIYLNQGNKADKAIELLNEAASLDKDNAIVYNNLGVAYAQKHDYANAERNYLLAKSFGAQNNINLGNTKIRQGDYNAALSYYGTVNACTYNAALAAALSGNYEQALKNLDCAKQNASVYYLRAVIAARTNNLDNLTTNLARAILEDQSLKAKAIKDLEFKKYADTDAFKVAVR